MAGGRSRRCLRAMIRMVRQQADCPIKLLGDDQPHQHVRQRERAERPALVGAGDHVRGMSFRTADQQREVTAEPTPVFQPLRQLLGRPWLARTIQRTTCASFGRAASTRPPSSSIARAGSRPLPRNPGSISTSSSGSQCDRRFRYSSNPWRPTLARFRRRRSGGLSFRWSPRFDLEPVFGRGLRWRVAIRRLVADRPQALKPVELADARQHDVDDDVAEIDKHPFGFALAFDAERLTSSFLGELDDFVGDGFDVARRGSGWRRP